MPKTRKPEQYTAFQEQASPWMKAVAPDGYFKII
jgi:hypothetical protein